MSKSRTVSRLKTNYVKVLCLYKVQNNLFHIANCNTIEGYVTQMGKWFGLEDVFFKFMGVANHFVP